MFPKGITSWFAEESIHIPVPLWYVGLSKMIQCIHLWCSVSVVKKVHSTDKVEGHTVTIQSKMAIQQQRMCVQWKGSGKGSH